MATDTTTTTPEPNEAKGAPDAAKAKQGKGRKAGTSQGRASGNGKQDGKAKQPREGSAMHGAITVLTGKRKPLHVNEIWSEMVEKGLHKSLKGKTPEATLGAQLAVAAKKGHHVERPEPGKYKLRSR